MKRQLDLFEYMEKQSNIKSLTQTIHNLEIDQEIIFSNICIRRTERFFETLMSDVFHECFREVDHCILFIKNYIETEEFSL